MITNDQVINELIRRKKARLDPINHICRCGNLKKHHDAMCPQCVKEHGLL